MSRDNTLSKEEKELLTLENEIKNRVQDKVRLENELESLAKNISQVKEKLITDKFKADGFIVNAQKESENIKALASSIYEKAKNTELALQDKMTELTEKERKLSVSQKQSDDLIKSNKGLEASLKSELAGVNNLKAKFNTLIDIIKKTLEV